MHEATIRACLSKKGVRNVSGKRWFMSPEDHILRIMYARKQIDKLLVRLQKLDENEILDDETKQIGEERIKKELSKLYHTISDSKKALLTTFNCNALSRSYEGPIPDEYYLTLIDKEGCVKGVIL